MHLPKEFTLPVQASTINVCPKEIVEKAYEEYSAQGNSDQSLERLCERGGFSWSEIASLLMDFIDKRDAEITRLNEVIQRTVKQDNDYINMLRERCQKEQTSDEFEAANQREIRSMENGDK
jgi:hypothetical protein